MALPRDDGRWWNPPALSNAFGRAMKTVDLPRIRLHDLRHTHATLLPRAGVNPKVVSERLGHSSVAFTLDTYTHVMPGMQSEAAERFMHVVSGNGIPDRSENIDDQGLDDRGDDQPDGDTNIDEETG